MELGLQLYTVRNYLRDDLEAGLKRFGDMGFKNVEFADFDPEALYQGMPPIRRLTVEEMNEMMARLGMKIISFSTPIPTDLQEALKMDFDWDAAAAYAAATGCVGVSVSMMFFRDRQEVLQFAEYCNEAAKACARHGVYYIYHNQNLLLLQIFLLY